MSGARRTLKLTIEYDGTGLVGWQRQKNGPSIQEHLETALAELLCRPTPIAGASRTDAGVHARGQVASFVTESTIPTHGIRRGLNSKLPPQIAVVAADEVAGDFHARHSARGKQYRYAIWLGADRSPLHRRTSWHRPRPLDVAAMTAAATAMVGEHDFSAFRASGCQARTTIRRVNRVELTNPEPHLVEIFVEGNAFLRNMVRIMVGTLVDVGEGRTAAAEVAEIIAGGDRAAGGQTAPPQGLTLMAVYY